MVKRLFRSPSRGRRLAIGFGIVAVILWRLGSAIFGPDSFSRDHRKPSTVESSGSVVDEHQRNENPRRVKTNANSKHSEKPAETPTSSKRLEFKPGDQEKVLVRRVVDGDTLLLQDGERVRVIGIDTPETKKEDTPVQTFGPEAATLTKRLCEGVIVELVFDQERYDNYGRLLAHVRIGRDELLSEKLLEQGLGRGVYRFPYSDEIKSRLRKAEARAKKAKRGIWGT